MSKPADLSRSDIARKLFLRLLLPAFLILALVCVTAPGYMVSVLYGLMIYLFNYLVFALYAFRFAGSRASAMIVSSYSIGVFVKMLLFAVALILVFRLDARAAEASQALTIIATYFFMQFMQISFSVDLARKL